MTTTTRMQNKPTEDPINKQADALFDVLSGVLTRSGADLTARLGSDDLITSLVGSANPTDGLFAIALSLSWVARALERLADIQEARQ